MDDLLPRLLALAGRQLELLRVFLYVASEGPMQYENEVVRCSLSEPRRRTAALTAMAAGQSVGTLISMAGLRGIPVRDMYPIARSAIESFVNAAFLAAETDAVAERALRYVGYATWKHGNRTVGAGTFELEIASSPNSKSAAAAGFSEFTGRGQGSWSALDVPNRIRVVGERAGKPAGSRLLAAYALVYSLSSEIIHGSVFGVSYFFRTPKTDFDVETFRQSTRDQIQDIFVAVLHALAGFLAAVFYVQGHKKLSGAESELFSQLLELGTAETPSTRQPLH